MITSAASRVKKDAIYRNSFGRGIKFTNSSIDRLPCRITDLNINSDIMREIDFVIQWRRLITITNTEIAHRRHDIAKQSALAFGRSSLNGGMYREKCREND